MEFTRSPSRIFKQFNSRDSGTFKSAGRAITDPEENPMFQGSLSMAAQPLLERSSTGQSNSTNLMEEEDFGCWYRCKRRCGLVISIEKRRVYMNGSSQPSSFCSNKINNQKYNFISFIPKVLFNEFKFFFNLFFLLIALSQFVPFLKVGFMFTYVAPLGFVLFVTLCKEAYDDFQRRKRDNQTNNTMYEVLKGRRGEQKEYELTRSQDLRVGMIVKINQNQRIPADLVLLYTTDRSGSVFIKTDQLDGETDWKLRKAIPQTQRIFNSSHQDLLNDRDSYIMSSAPNDAIYDFKGVFQLQGYRTEYHTESLSLENTCWSNTVLASSGFLIGQVIHTGVETRMSMNASQPRMKVGKLDDEVNWLSKVLFLLMCLSSALIIVADGFRGEWYFKYFRCLLLLCSIIPISMRINLDLAKIYYSYGIQNDNDISGCIVRNSSIPEELGRIQYLLCDKTGTLTQNEMTFKKVAMEFAQFGEDEKQDFLAMLQEGFANGSQGPYGDYELVYDESYKNVSLKLIEMEPSSDKKFNRRMKKNIKRREPVQLVRDLVLALCLCHNVTPVYPDEDKKSRQQSQIDNDVSPVPLVNERRFGLESPHNSSLCFTERSDDKDFNPLKDNRKKEFQASSPDEIALVTFAEDMGVKLLQRDDLFILLQNPSGELEEYDILQNFPFSSETKRMGIIVKHKATQKIIFFVKGADEAMINKVKPAQRGTCAEYCEYLSMEGLRTLVITQKFLFEKDYRDFEKKLRAAKSQLNHREKAVQEVISELEKDMDFLGVTGVEDKLQERVLQTIETIRQAGIPVWMLTGDKVETAKCIAISTGLKSSKQGIFEMRDLRTVGDVENKISEFNNKFNNQMLIVDGVTLSMLQNNTNLLERFFMVAQKAKSVCCCRCSPTQKALIARTLKQMTAKRVACVGDGGNDVAMIQEADVGLGIVGKEGNQASLAADFSILEFQHLSQLILWHGRLSYKRSAALSQFVVHRGMIISFIQAIFTCIFYYVTIPIYNGFLILGYSTIYTALPVFSLVLDHDVDHKKVVQYPALYITLQKGRSMNFKTFMIWTFKSIYQACVIMFVAISDFNEPFVNLVTITFTTLILIELLNVISEVNTLKPPMIVSMLFTLMIYLLSIVMFRNYFEVSYIDGIFVLKVLVLTLAAWLPLHVLKKLMIRWDPNQEQKIMREID